MFILLIFVCAAVLSLTGSASGEYLKVYGQTNAVLKSSEALFGDFLFASAVFKADDVTFECLSQSDYEKYMATVPNWSLNTSIPSIFRSFAFNDFKSAFLFMSQGAQLAEKNQHHPGKPKHLFKVGHF